jgi:hypothetical protein
MATLVTAFFDINREQNGDGRKLAEYMEWMKKTLQINGNLYIVTEEKFVPFIQEHRPFFYPTVIKVNSLKDCKYYQYYEQMSRILKSDEYRKKIQHPNRVECILPEYNLIQYSKLGWLEDAIEEDPFHTQSFFWMDMGISRFFLDVDISKPYPGPCIHTTDKFIIQQRHDLLYYPIDEEFAWKSDNLLKGTMFGGDKEVIRNVSKELEHVFKTQMIDKDIVNNEQIGLVLVWKQHPEWFHLVDDYRGVHLILFKILSQ